jgi:hypothetical protein
MSIVPNLGVFASYDPVAIDKACLDMAKNAEGVPTSAAEDMGVLESGTHKFEVCAPLLAGLTEDIQVNTGEIIGMGTRNYEIVKVAEKAQTDFIFPPDPRPIGLRMKEKFTKFLFPYDNYFIERRDGKNFQRKESVDLERVNTYYENAKKLVKTRAKK